MSFILDALKKSEYERQRQSTPGLVESTVARPRQRLPLWAVALCALLAINLLVLLFMLLRGRPAPAAAAAPPTAAAADRHFSPLDPPTVDAPEIPVTAPVAPPLAAPLAPVAAPPRAATASSGEHRVRRRDPLLSEDNYQPNEDEVLPSVDELNLSGAQTLPELHLDVHVFATRAADRFVFINMRKYHEGAVMQEGPTIERIRRDGVILDYQGLRFLLPRR